MHAYIQSLFYCFIFHLFHISCCLEPLTTYCHACGWEDEGVWVSAYACTASGHCIKLTKQNKSKQYMACIHVLYVLVHAL